MGAGIILSALSNRDVYFNSNTSALKNLLHISAVSCIMKIKIVVSGGKKYGTVWIRKEKDVSRDSV